MNPICGDDPVRWWQWDAWCKPCRMESIPAPGAVCWEVSYDNDCERGKRTSRQLQDPLERVQVVLESDASIAAWVEYLGYAVCADPTHHGGGLHVTAPGGWLNTHLDYDLHPIVPGRRRALNLIAFLNPVWEESWGGAFVLTDSLGVVRKRVFPAPGRLFAFEVGDLSYHGVEPVTGPEERVSCACYLLAKTTGRETRKRAMFFPKRA